MYGEVDSNSHNYKFVSYAICYTRKTSKPSEDIWKRVNIDDDFSYIKATLYSCLAARIIRVTSGAISILGTIPMVPF